jgi:predicted Zn-dependent protease
VGNFDAVAHGRPASRPSSGGRESACYSAEVRRFLLAAALILGPAAGPLAAAPQAATPADDALIQSRRVFLSARSAVADGRYQEALDLYRKALTLVPNDPIVHLEYAQLLRDLNVADEATREAREAVRLDPNLAEARRLLGALELAAADKDPSRLPAAIEQLNAARRLAPNDIASAVSLARALLAADRPKEAAAVLDELPELAGQPIIQRMSAEAKAKSGRWKEAEGLYKGLLAQDQGDREIAAALVDLYEDQDEMDEALALLGDLAHRDPDNSAIQERIVLDLARAGKFDEAEKRARDLVAKRPENRAGKRLLAIVLFERESSAEGEKILRGLIDADPEDDSTRRALASELVRERRFPEARAMYEDMIRRAGDDPKKADLRDAAKVELGFIAYLDRNWAETRRILEPLAVVNGKVSPRAARIALAADRDAENYAAGLALAKSLAAADADPEWAAAQAEFRYRAGETKAAEAELEKLAASGEIEKMMAASDVYARLKKFGESARIARDASAKNPDNTEAQFRLGSSLERNGEGKAAEDVFLKLLEQRPHDAATQNYLGYMWADKGVQLDRAREMLEKAVGREPRNAAYLDSLGWVYFRLGRIDSAEKNLREAHRREPTDPTIAEHLGDLEMKRGHSAEAIQNWEKALELQTEEPERVRQKLERARAPVSQR